jgi:hypothetical protein
MGVPARLSCVRVRQIVRGNPKARGTKLPAERLGVKAWSKCQVTIHGIYGRPAAKPDLASTLTLWLGEEGSETVRRAAEAEDTVHSLGKLSLWPIKRRSTHQLLCRPPPPPLPLPPSRGGGRCGGWVGDTGGLTEPRGPGCPFPPFPPPSLPQPPPPHLPGPGHPKEGGGEKGEDPRGGAWGVERARWQG